MAKLGNEARLILKLARERIKNSDALKIDLNYLNKQGNSGLRNAMTLDEAQTRGYNIGIKDYYDTLNLIVQEIEGK